MLHLLDDGFQHRELVRDVESWCCMAAISHSGCYPRAAAEDLVTVRAQISRCGRRIGTGSQTARTGLPSVWWMERGWSSGGQGVSSPSAGLRARKNFFPALRSRGVAVMRMRAVGPIITTTAGRLLPNCLELRRQHEADAFSDTEKDLVGCSRKRVGCLKALRRCTREVAGEVPMSNAISSSALLPMNWRTRRELHSDP